MVVEAVTTSGRAAGVEFRPGPLTVQVWHGGRCWAELGYADLSRLLSSPGQRLLIRRVELRSDAPGCVSITLDDVHDWLLSPAEAAKLAAFAENLVSA